MKRTLACILCAVILLTLTACSGTSLPEPLPAPTDELVVYVPPSLIYEEALGRAAHEFERENPEVELRMVDFDPAVEYTGDGFKQIPGAAEEYASRLTTELNAGKGPDVILFNFAELADVYKSMKGGVFCDLNPFMEADEDFSFTDYTGGALDCGMLGGERLFVPIEYTVSGVAVMLARLESAGLTLPDEPDFAAFDALLKDGVRNGEGERLLSYPFYLKKWLFDSGLRTVDYETGEVLVDTDEFRAVIEQVKLMYPYRFQGEVSVNNPKAQMDDVAAGRSLVQVGGIYEAYGVDLLRSYDPALRPFWFPKPTADGKAVASPGICAGIRASSPNRANAYAYIKALLSATVQLNLFEVPVHTDTLQSRLTRASLYMEGADSSGATLYALTENDTDRLFEAFTDVRPPSDYDMNVISIVVDHMTPYWEGHASYEDCAAQLKNYLEIYIYE